MRMLNITHTKIRFIEIVWKFVFFNLYMLHFPEVATKVDYLL